MVRILRYIFFPIVFLLSLMLCNIILAPILGFFYSFMEILAYFISSEPPSFLWEFVIEPAMISGICAYCSFMLALLVYPGNNHIIPILICSSILIVLLIFTVIVFNTTINILLEINSNESLEDISKPRFYISIFSTLIGYTFAAFTVQLKR